MACVQTQLFADEARLEPMLGDLLEKRTYHLRSTRHRDKEFENLGIILPNHGLPLNGVARLSTHSHRALGPNHVGVTQWSGRVHQSFKIAYARGGPGKKSTMLGETEDERRMAEHERKEALFSKRLRPVHERSDRERLDCDKNRIVRRGLTPLKAMGSH